MEILGIVWAASIICPASTATKSTQDMCAAPTLQQESLSADAVAEWPRSRSKIHGLAMSADWATGLEVIANAFPKVGALAMDDHVTPQASSFQALLPAIGASLKSFEPADEPAPLTVNQAATADPPPFLDARWHSWSAVAAVRIEPGLPSPQPDALLPSSEYCLPTTSAPYQPSPADLKTAPKQQVWVHDQFIGQVAGKAAAQEIAAQLRELIQSGQLQPAQLKPFAGKTLVGVMHGDALLFVVDETLQPHPEVPAAVTAVQWVNNLRLAMNAAPMDLADMQMAVQGLTETSETLYGSASWYGPKFHGRQTANGEIFDENALTAAHKTLPFNTQLKVTNRMNGRSVIVRINDRGPYIGQRSLDLSKAAAHCLGSTQSGVVPYEAVILEPVSPIDFDDLTTAQLPHE